MLRKAYGLTLIALLLAGAGYMSYEMAVLMWDLLVTASPGERVKIVLVLTLTAISVVCRIIVAILDQVAKRNAA